MTSLVECKECGAMISRGARTCPRCGKPRYIARLRQGLFLMFLEIACVMIVLAWFLWRVGLIKLSVG